MPDKKLAAKAAKPAAKSAAKKAAAAPTAKKAAAAKPVKAAKAPPPKVAPKAAKPEPKPKAAAKKPEPKPAKAKAAPKPAAKAKPEPKTKAALKAPAKAAKPAPEPKPAKVKATKPEPAPKPAKAEKPAKAAKTPKPPKPPKPPKLAPVAAAFAGPIPSKPLAVAAGRAQPVTRSAIATPPRSAPKPLAAPKPVAAAGNEPEVVGDPQSVPTFKAKANGGKAGLVLVGAVAGAFGVKGEVRLRAFTEKREGVISYGPLYGEDGKILLKPKSWRELKDGVAVVAAEIKSREDAEKLKGTRLFVPRANLPAPAEDEFYIVDLLGCKAESVDGQVLGEICAVWNFGAGDIIEYRPPNGAPNVRITFTRETAPLVDLAGKRVVLDPPPPEPANGK